MRHQESWMRILYLKSLHNDANNFEQNSMQNALKVQINIQLNTPQKFTKNHPFVSVSKSDTYLIYFD
jgi:hypothetical protein